MIPKIRAKKTGSTPWWTEEAGVEEHSAWGAASLMEMTLSVYAFENIHEEKLEKI
jgi:hypothetical protein